MSATTFLHGVEVDEVASATQPIAFNPSGVVGLIGTAALADDTVFPLNEPVLLNSQPTQALKLGATGTLLTAVQQSTPRARARSSWCASPTTPTPTTS